MVNGIDMSIYDKLFPFQKHIVDKFKNRSAFGLFLDMGCGKTPLSLALAEINNCTKIIIITINSKAIEHNTLSGSFLWWLDKSKFKYNYYTKQNNFDSSGPKKYQVTISNSTNDVLIVNYESLFSRAKDRTKKMELKSNIIDFINSCKDKNVAIIVDESHRIKETNSLQTLAVKKIQQLMHFKTANVFTYLCTGTPFTTGFLDLYSQLNILGWSGTKTQFIDLFCIRGQLPSLLPWQQPIVAYKNINTLYELIHKFAITIKSEEVIDLPQQIYVNHSIPNSSEMKLFTSEKMKMSVINDELKARNLNDLLISGKQEVRANNPFYRNIAYPELNWVADTVSTFWLRSRQLSIGFQGNEENAIWYDKSRLNELKRLLEQNEDNYVLFYNFTPEFVELYEICESLGYKIDVYNGLVKSLHYYEEYEKMSDSEKLVDKKRIILSNFASGSTGKNWQLYNKCIMFSLPLFKDWSQSIKRVHRLGQKENVTYHIFYQDNWLDTAMSKALKEQKEYDKNLFESDLKTNQEVLEND